MLTNPLYMLWKLDGSSERFTSVVATHLIPLELGNHKLPQPYTLWRELDWVDGNQLDGIS